MGWQTVGSLLIVMIGFGAVALWVLDMVYGKE
jgi:hypothetical protein